MNFLENFIQEDPSGNTSLIIILITIFLIVVIFSAFLFDYFRNAESLKKIGMLERAIKDLIEEFRSLELNFSEQKKNSQRL